MKGPGFFQSLIKYLQGIRQRGGRVRRLKPQGTVIVEAPQRQATVLVCGHG